MIGGNVATQIQKLFLGEISPHKIAVPAACHNITFHVPEIVVYTIYSHAPRHLREAVAVITPLSDQGDELLAGYEGGRKTTIFLFLHSYVNLIVSFGFAYRTLTFSFFVFANLRTSALSAAIFYEIVNADMISEANFTVAPPSTTTAFAVLHAGLWVLFWSLSSQISLISFKSNDPRI